MKAILATLALVVCSEACASTQFYEFSGVLSESQTGQPFNEPIPAVGIPFSGIMAYDPAAYTCNQDSGGALLRDCGATQGTGIQWAVTFGQFTLLVGNQFAGIYTDGNVLFQCGQHLILPLDYHGYTPTAQTDTYLNFSEGPDQSPLTGLPDNLSAFQKVGLVENAYFISNGPGPTNLVEWDFGGQATDFPPDQCPCP